jgi:uncharacterized protein (DUF2132 family)
MQQQGNPLASNSNHSHGSTEHYMAEELGQRNFRFAVFKVNPAWRRAWKFCAKNTLGARCVESLYLYVASEIFTQQPASSQSSSPPRLTASGLQTIYVDDSWCCKQAGRPASATWTR